MEADGHHVGWQVSIYPPEPATVPVDLAATYPDVDSCTRLASVTHHSAHAELLPDLIELALRGRRRHEHHTFAVNGTHSVRLGIDHY